MTRALTPVPLMRLLLLAVVAVACGDDEPAGEGSPQDLGSTAEVISPDVATPDDAAEPVDPGALVDLAPPLDSESPPDPGLAQDLMVPGDEGEDEGTSAPDPGPVPDPGPEPVDSGPPFELPKAAGVYAYGLCDGGDPVALFVAEQTPPATMSPGQSAPVHVVLANCGAETWLAAPAVGSKGHKLGSQSPQDNTHWGMQRVALPADVQPGQMVRVDFQATAPAQPAPYGYQWKLVDEGVAWIDEPTPEHFIDVKTSDKVATLGDLFAGTAKFVVDQDPVPVVGPSSGHREAFAVNRTDVGPATVYLYHRCFGQSAADASICLSISHDGGGSFSEFLGEIVGPDPGHIFSVAPAVIQKSGTWYMAYEESHVAAVYWAQSADGKAWTKKGQLLDKKSSAWDGGANATPGAFVDTDGKIYVFWAGFPVGGDKMSVGYASGTAMKSLKKYAGNPVLAPAAAGWSKGQVSMARVVRQGDTYYMVHEGAEVDFTCAGYNRYGWGMAKSSDLKSWTPLPQNPLGQASSGCGNDMPSLFVRFDGHVFVYHTSKDTKRIVREHLVPK